MASELTLEINGRKRDILRYNYRFHREIQYNRPVDSIWGGEICVEMTSDGDTYFLEMLMAEKEVIKEIANGTRKTFTVPAAVSGKIQFIKENEIFRELSFQEAYVVFYGERMSSIGPKSMSTFLVISPMKMEVNKRVMMVKRQDTGINLGWVQKVEEEPKPTSVIPYTVPTLLVKAATGKSEALPNEVIEYKVTSYNLSNVSDSDRRRVKWDIEIDGKQETLSSKGESIELEMKREWLGKSISLMPYIKQPTPKVRVETHIQCNHKDGAKIVAEYIVNEIKTNTRSKIADSIRYYASYEEYEKRYEEWKKRTLLGQLLTQPEPQNLLKAKMLWTERVFAKRPWDHKPKIRDRFRHLAVERTNPQTQVVYKSYYHKYKDYDYFYDVWSNIHYGYVGLSVGFDEDMLLNGADLAQIIDSKGNNAGDTDDDKTSIKIGFTLYYKYGKYADGLTANDILEALDAAIMTESKLKHVCLAK